MGAIFGGSATRHGQPGAVDARRAALQRPSGLPARRCTSPTAAAKNPKDSTATPEDQNARQITVITLETPIKLNLGCGNDLREGYINLDRFPSTPDVVQANLPEIPYPDNHADEIVLSHVLEHFGYADGKRLLGEVLRVLKPNGLAFIEVPDCAWCCAQFLGAPEPNNYTEPNGDYGTGHRWGLWAQAIWGDQHNDGLFHKWGYTGQRLLYTLHHVGFGAIQVDFIYSHSVQCLSAKAQKQVA